MAYDPNNIFAKILRGEIPALKILEDEHALAFGNALKQCVKMNTSKSRH